jgi:hypothetical protein
VVCDTCWSGSKKVVNNFESYYQLILINRKENRKFRDEVIICVDKFIVPVCDLWNVLRLSSSMGVFGVDSYPAAFEHWRHPCKLCYSVMFCRFCMISKWLTFVHFPLKNQKQRSNLFNRKSLECNWFNIYVLTFILKCRLVDMPYCLSKQIDLQHQVHLHILVYIHTNTRENTLK